jgi:uncharacterized metal-binding protein YceD (DUF177 family)
MKIKQREDNLYAVQVSGLATGNHDFQFDIERKLFDKFENDEAQNIKVNAEVRVIKRPNIVELEINLKGFVTLVCDRCLSDFDLKLEVSETAIAKQATENPDNEINIIIFEPETGDIVFDQYFYDMIMTALPMQRIHNDEEKCDLDMLERLEVKDSSSVDEIDPRWNDLKNLI